MSVFRLVKQSITFKMLKVVFSIYFAITFALTSMHLYAEYLNARENIVSQLETLGETFVPGLRNAIWFMDSTALQTTAQGIYKNPIVIGLQIVSDKGKTLIELGQIYDENNQTIYAANHMPDTDTPSEEPIGANKAETVVIKHSNQLIPHRFEIIHAANNMKIATAVIYSSSDIVFDQVKYGYLFIIINAVIKTLAIWYIFLWVGNKYLTQPLGKLSKQVEDRNISNLSKVDVVNKQELNELNIVENSFNHMIDDLQVAVAEREEYMRQLNLSRRHLDNVFNAVDVCLVLVDDDFKVKNLNREAMAFFDTKEQDAIGSSLEHMFSKHQLSDLIRKIKEANHKRGGFSVERVKIDMQRFSLYAVAKLSKHATDLSKSHAVILTNDNQLYFIIDGELSTNKAGTPTIINLDDRFSIPENESDVPKHCELLDLKFCQALQIKLAEIGIEFSHPKYINIMSYPVFDSAMTYTVIKIEDISEQVHVESILIQTEKMNSLGTLCAGIAHELNNPLASIMQSSQNIQRRLDPNVKKNLIIAEECDVPLEKILEYHTKRQISEFVDGIKASSIRASSIIGNILRFSKMQGADEFQQLDINSLIRDVLEIIQSDYDLKKNLKSDHEIIQFMPDMNCKLLTCVPTEIEQVLFNLLKNSLYALSKKEFKDDFPSIKISTTSNTDSCTILIRDNATGITPSDVNKIFTPFYTTKPVGIGTGLRLSLSHTIITKRHKGVISVESEYGSYTQFTIILRYGDLDDIPEPEDAAIES